LLVFMSGLFGAQALRSPLSDVPSPKARTAHQLEAIIEAALLPDTFNKARMAREAMHPVEPVHGFTNAVRLNELDPESATHVRDVLNAGATIGAVRHTERAGEYLVRAELYEFLCAVIKRELKRRPEETKRGLELNELETRMTEALLPSVGETADAVLRHLHPIDEVRGFTSEIFMSEIEPHHVRPVRNVLTAGSSLRVVQRDRTDRDRYYVHGDLYKALARIRARSLLAVSGERAKVAWGGALHVDHPAIADGRGDQRLLANGRQPARADGLSDDELRAHFQERLMESIGLSAASLQKVLSPDIAHQALAAADLLKRKARSYRSLGDELRFLESTTRHTLEQARASLAQQFDGDMHALGILSETVTEIDARVPTLILLPESRLIDSLIAALEEGQADNRLGEDENRLLGRLRSLKKDLEALDWNDEAAWGRLVHKIDRLNEVGPSASNIVGDGTKLH
jgi:hypothetical protein